MRLWLGLTAAALAASAALAADDIGKKMTDPVTLKQITVTKETPLVVVNGAKLYFTDAKTRETFLKTPENYLKTPLECPVRNIKGRPNRANRMVVNDQIIYFCCAGCPMGFQKEPNSYLFKVTDPVSAKEFDLSADAPKASYKGGLYFFENEANKGKFEADPGKYAKVVLQ